MNAPRRFLFASLLVLPLLSSVSARAQDDYMQGYDAPVAETPDGDVIFSGMLTPSQLDQITAPVALYPDGMLGNIFVAATYPDQVIAAATWRDDPEIAALDSATLTAALQQQPWDASVKAVAADPRLLFLMANNQDWMVQLGNAFVTQRDDVMDSIQRARWQAYRAGRLLSDHAQSVVVSGGYVLVEPVAPAARAVWVVPFWDWGHHRINSREDIRRHGPDAWWHGDFDHHASPQPDYRGVPHQMPANAPTRVAPPAAHEWHQESPHNVPHNAAPRPVGMPMPSSQAAPHGQMPERHDDHARNNGGPAPHAMPAPQHHDDSRHGGQGGDNRQYQDGGQDNNGAPMPLGYHH